MDTSSGAPQAYPSTPGLYHLTTQAEGQTIYYTLRIPADYDGRTALPVILSSRARGDEACTASACESLAALVPPALEREPDAHRSMRPRTVSARRLAIGLRTTPPIRKRCGSKL